jgi:hypothetical protein
LSIQLASSSAEPGLRNLCGALRKQLENTTTFDHPNKPALLAGYGRILGVPAANLV